MIGRPFTDMIIQRFTRRLYLISNTTRRARSFSHLPWATWAINLAQLVPVNCLEIRIAPGNSANTVFEGGTGVVFALDFTRFRDIANKW